MRLVEYEGVTSNFHQCGACLLGDLACDFFCFLFRKSGFQDLAFDHLILRPVAARSLSPIQMWLRSCRSRLWVSRRPVVSLRIFFSQQLVQSSFQLLVLLSQRYSRFFAAPRTGDYKVRFSFLLCSHATVYTRQDKAFAVPTDLKSIFRG